MDNLRLFRYLQPYFFAGLLDDPVLVINTRPTGRSIMIDCGQIHHIAKRVLRSVDAVFISHAHMDHFMGFDHLLRHVHVAPRDIQVFGPPGMAERVAHKLAGYDWNLAEKHWCKFLVREVHPHGLAQFEFAGSQGFVKRHLKTVPRYNRCIYQTPYLRVEAALCDHKIPTLSFLVTERESFRIDRQRLQQAALVPGPWLRELKKRFHAGNWGQPPMTVWQRTSSGQPGSKSVSDVAALYQSICSREPPASIGFISDVGYTERNRSILEQLVFMTTLLFSECTFLGADLDKARESSHLCTTDLNQLVEKVSPRYLVPMHLSKSYLGSTSALYRELVAPEGTTILQLPEYLTPRPILPRELVGSLTASQDRNTLNDQGNG